MAIHQQKILEDYEGMKNIKDFETSLKRKVVKVNYTKILYTSNLNNLF